jgi:general secretion pathway protein G
MNQTHVKNGFTLIEILIAIAIVAIMGGGAVFYAQKYRAKAKDTSTRSTLKVLESAIDEYNLDLGEYPSSLRDLVFKPSSEKAAEKWSPYLKKKEVPKDGFGRDFHYEVTPDAEHPYELYSYGAVGKGGAKNKWINVWDI